MSTIKAPFGGGVELVNLDNGSSIPGGFVLQLPDELTPSHVGDGFSQAVVLDHVLDLQTLDAYDLVFAYDLSRELVLIVTSTIRNLLMDASDLETSLVSILRAFFLLGVPPLGSCQFLFILVEELGIPMSMPIGGDDHGLQAQVKSYLFIHHRQGLNVFLNQDGDKVAIRFIFGDRDTTWLASIGQGSAPDDVNRGIHLGKSKMFSIPGKSIARIGSRLLVTLLFEGGIRCTPFKEVAEGFIEMAQGLLQRNRRNFIEPDRLFLLFEQYQTLRCCLVVQTLTTLVVRICALSQGPIIDIATTPEGLCQYSFLFIAWGEAILVGFLLFHALQYSTYTVKHQEAGRFHPAPCNGAGLSAPLI